MIIQIPLVLMTIFMGNNLWIQEIFSNNIIKKDFLEMKMTIFSKVVSMMIILVKILEWVLVEWDLVKNGQDLEILEHQIKVDFPQENPYQNQQLSKMVKESV